MIEFELKPLRKFTIPCPKCNDFRDKSNTKSLTVYRDTDGIVRWQCFHANQCEWNERQWMKDPNPEEVSDLPATSSESATILGSRDLVLPTEYQGSKIWWLRNDNKEPVFGVIRKDKEGRKVYYPVTVARNGQPEILPSWPNGKYFYRPNPDLDSNKILVVEGEKTADAAQLLFPAVSVLTWRGGSSNVTTAPWEILKNKTITLWPDNDGIDQNFAGQEAMKKIVSLLDASNTVYMVDPRVVWLDQKKQDLADEHDFNLVCQAIKSATLIKKVETEFVSVEEIDLQSEQLGYKFVTGWKEVDEQINFPSSGVIVLEGRTGHAKTGTAINIANNFLVGGGVVHLFSYEIPASRVFGRFVRIGKDELTEPSEQDLENKKELTKQWISDKKLNIYDQSKQIPLTKLKEILNRDVYRGSLIIIDYAQIVPCKSSEMRNKMIDLMDTLRIQANTHGFLVLLLSQLTPDYANPLHDAPRDAKDIHFSAEMVLRVWNKDNEYGHPLYDDVPGNFVLHVLKNRDGESGHLIGCVWDRGAYLEPNGTITKAGRIKHPENKSTKALETIAEVLKQQFGGF